jgi:acetylornithine deacetylase/succinyl-diaminopimelate desuccinylase-like protein
MVLEDAQDEVVSICQDLLRIDTSNRDGHGDERVAAEYVVAKLSEVGVSTKVFHPRHDPTRTSVICTVEGTDPTQAPMLIHSHLDVVPADEGTGWSIDPFGGELKDGYLWGRGAVDMKNMVAAKLAIIRSWMRSGTRPCRKLVFAFLADEEAGGERGAKWLVSDKPHLFDGCTIAVGEVGGFSFQSPRSGRRLYFVETAEKGMCWIEVEATGDAGHGSAVRRDSAPLALVRALSKLAAHEFPIRMTRTTSDMLRRLGQELEIELDPANLSDARNELSPILSVIESSIRNTANITELHSGNKVNVIPGTALAKIDGRFLPGCRDDFIADINSLLGPGVKSRQIILNDALETADQGSLGPMARSLRAEDPDAVVIPYLLSAGTDAKYFSKLGMHCFGFCPLRLPKGLDFFKLFHGVDERIPVDALRFSVRVLGSFLSQPY